MRVAWIAKSLLAALIPKNSLLSWVKNIVVAVSLCGSPWLMAAPLVTAEVPLDFGEMAVKSNTAVSTLQITSAGTVTFSGDVIPLGGAMRGEYRLTGFPPGVLLEVTLDNANLSAGGGGLPELLLVTNYDAPTLLSDPSGEALVPLGASLKTNGSTVMYVDAPYSGTTQIRVRYWSEPDTNYLTYYDSVDFNVVLRTAITLEEDQATSFGSLAAYADPVDKATMTLATNGSVNVVNVGNARITYLGAAQAGVIRVSGAAPSYTVNITPEAGSVFLTHVTSGTSAARFIAKSFVTQPSGTGFTDPSGDLQILVGATLETELTNKLFDDGTYSGTYTLEVTY